MRIGLIVAGIILLIIGSLLYYVPTDTGSVTKTTVQAGDVTTRTVYGTLLVPAVVSLAIALIGFALLVLGFAISAPYIEVRGAEASQVVESDDVEDSEESTEPMRMHEESKHRIIRHHHEKHVKAH